jgi:hypothetical protein
MSTTLGLTLLACASTAVTLIVARTVLAPRATSWRQKEALGITDEDLEAQVTALRAMVLQLRIDLAEAQRENEQSRVRDLELLRLRGAELVREAEVRAVSSDRARQRAVEPLPQEARQVLAAISAAQVET